MMKREQNSLYLDSCPPCLWKGGWQQGRRTLHKHWGCFCCVIPVGVGRGQHELELNYTSVVLQLPMLNAVQLICDVGSSDVHLRKSDISRKMTSNIPITFLNCWLSNCYLSYLKRSHPDYLITVVKEVWEDIKDGCFRQDQFLRTEKGHFLLFTITVIHLNAITSCLFTCRFSMQNWCPYMSIADRKMDSTWLCRSS